MMTTNETFRSEKSFLRWNNETWWDDTNDVNGAWMRYEEGRIWIRYNRNHNNIEATKLVRLKVMYTLYIICLDFIHNIWNTYYVSIFFLCKTTQSWIPWNLSLRYMSLSWSIHTKDESKRETAFAFIFGVNWLWRCGVTASFRVFLYEIRCNGMMIFMEFMRY